MIREEVEKLRGFVFTDDELRDVILPMLTATKPSKVEFKKAMKIFADEFNNYFTLEGGAGWRDDVKYDGQVVGKKIRKQRESDWNSFVDFINSRLDDEVLDKMVKDGTLADKESKKDV